jgi:hypothetical protein
VECNPGPFPQLGYIRGRTPSSSLLYPNTAPQTEAD